MPVARRPWNTGVYAIRNKGNGKVYVGSAAGAGGFVARWREHKSQLRCGVHNNTHLMSAWMKYGEDAFEFVILLRCPPERCLKNEQFFINKFRSQDRDFGYNACPVAGSMLGFRFSEKSREKIADRMMGNNYRKGKPSPFRGKVHSDDAKAKMSASRKGRVITPEWRVKLSASMKGRKKSPETIAKMRAARRARVREQP